MRLSAFQIQKILFGRFGVLNTVSKLKFDLNWETKKKFKMETDFPGIEYVFMFWKHFWKTAAPFKVH